MPSNPGDLVVKVKGGSMKVGSGGQAHEQRVLRLTLQNERRVNPTEALSIVKAFSRHKNKAKDLKAVAVFQCFFMSFVFLCQLFFYVKGLGWDAAFD